MKKYSKMFVFKLLEQSYAIDLFSVEKVIEAVEITPVPGSIKNLAGVINIHGKIVPVLNIRKKFNMPEREIDIDDYIVIVKISEKTVAFIADSLVGVIDIPEDKMIQSAEILPDLQNIEGIIKLPGDMIFIHDLEKTLSFEVKNDIDALDALQNG